MVLERRKDYMEEDKQIINVTPDEEGRTIIELYGKKLELHESMFNEDGLAELKKYGQTFYIQKPVKKKRTYTRKPKVEEPEESETESES